MRVHELPHGITDLADVGDVPMKCNPSTMPSCFGTSMPSVFSRRGRSCAYLYFMFNFEPRLNARRTGNVSPWL